MLLNYLQSHQVLHLNKNIYFIVHMRLSISFLHNCTQLFQQLCLEKIIQPKNDSHSPPVHLTSPHLTSPYHSAKPLPATRLLCRLQHIPQSHSRHHLIKRNKNLTPYKLAASVSSSPSRKNICLVTPGLLTLLPPTPIRQHPQLCPATHNTAPIIPTLPTCTSGSR